MSANPLLLVKINWLCISVGSCPLISMRYDNITHLMLVSYNYNK